MIDTSNFGLFRSVLLYGCFLHAVTASFSQVAANPGKARPSVVLISVDTLRADRLGTYGYTKGYTPNIDGLAVHGTVFTAASALVPLTLPSHVSTLSSTYPFSNGITDNGQQLHQNIVTLASVLKAEGYRTAAFVGGFVLDSRFGLDKGFDSYDSPFGVHHDEGGDPGDIKRLGGDVIASVGNWLAKPSNRPFFLFVHLYDLHTPYNLPASFRTRASGLSGYEAELAYVDDVLGSLLRRRGLLDKCLIVFTSDHGEGLGDHGESAHGYFIYDTTTRVPLIFRWPPGTSPLPARVNSPVSLIDVAPTILQFLRLSPPSQFQGRSMLRLLKSPPSQAEEQIYSESEYGHRHFGVSALRSIRVGDYKYIDAPKPELYNLVNDPGETSNLYGQKTPQATTLRQLLTNLRNAFPGPTSQGASPTLSPEIAERLRALGYLAHSTVDSTATAPLEDPKDRIREFEEYGRALMLSSFGRLEEANGILERLQARLPGLIDVSICLGFNKQRQGQYQESAELFKGALQQDPTNAVAHFDLAVSYYALRKLDDAAKELEVTLAIAPYYTRARELLGTMSMEQGDYAGARSHFAEILKTAPDDYAAHIKLGIIALAQSQWNEAELQLKSALKTDPSSAEAHNTLGSVYLYQGILDQSADEFREAIRLNPKFVIAHYNLGLVNAKQGRKAEATREFEAALSLNPQFQAAQDALKRLQDTVQ